MKSLTLVVMAAGMGSRFGGLKQITPIDDKGNFIIDYSVYDAKKAGFNKIVFVIKKENLNDFKKTVGKRLEGQIEVCYAFQKLTDIPIEMDISARVKPWGTVQALLCAREYIDGPFAVINADDFYGADAFIMAKDFLSKNNYPNTYANISYSFGNSRSMNGTVKRGILFLKNDHIVSIIESSVALENDHFVAYPLSGEQSFSISLDTPVSMNFFAFKPDIFELLEEYWNNFFNQKTDELLEKEALLPQCINDYLHKGRIELINCPTISQWLGITYQSDLEYVKKMIHKMKMDGEYPEDLWG